MSKEKAPNEMSREEIIKKLHAEGVDTVEKLVDRVLAFRGRRTKRPCTPSLEMITSVF
jgi:hypothetical protein